MDGKRRWGWALGQSTLGLSRTVVGACCWGRLWSREAQGPVSLLVGAVGAGKRRWRGVVWNVRRRRRLACGC